MDKRILNTIGVLGIIWFISNIVTNLINQTDSIKTIYEEIKEIENKATKGTKMGFIKED